MLFQFNQIARSLLKLLTMVFQSRVCRFIDILGCELHTINDPDDKFPIPKIRPVISIRRNRMLVEQPLRMHAAFVITCTHLLGDGVLRLSSSRIRYSEGRIEFTPCRMNAAEKH